MAQRGREGDEYLLEDVLYCLFRDTMLIKVDEPDFLEPINNFVRCLPSLGLR